MLEQNFDLNLLAGLPRRNFYENPKEKGILLLYHLF